MVAGSTDQDRAVVSGVVADRDPVPVDARALDGLLVYDCGRQHSWLTLSGLHGPEIDVYCDGGFVCRMKAGGLLHTLLLAAEEYGGCARWYEAGGQWFRFYHAALWHARGGPVQEVW